MSTLAQRGEVIALLSEAIGMGARQDRACMAICLSERTLQRWQRGRLASQAAQTVSPVS